MHVAAAVALGVLLVTTAVSGVLITFFPKFRTSGAVKLHFGRYYRVEASGGALGVGLLGLSVIVVFLVFAVLPT